MRSKCSLRNNPQKVNTLFQSYLLLTIGGAKSISPRHVGGTFFNEGVNVNNFSIFQAGITSDELNWAYNLNNLPNFLKADGFLFI